MRQVDLTYNPVTLRLYSNGGSFWVMGSLSTGNEQDAGTRYPTLMQDSNGNQVVIRYGIGVGVNWENTCARIKEIEDVRATRDSSPPNTWRSYKFSYNTDPLPHLTQIDFHMGVWKSYTFTYLANQPLNSPFSPPQSFGTTHLLRTVTDPGQGLTHTFSYGANSSGELTQVDFPYGGHLRWDHWEYAFTDGRTFREVQYRYLAQTASGAETTVTMSRNASEPYHNAAFLDDPAGGGMKVWTLMSCGLVSSYYERPAMFEQDKLYREYTWVNDAQGGNGYIGSLLTVLDPGKSYEARSKLEQTLDQFGNVTQSKIYNYGDLITPARTYTNTYLTGTNYSSRFINNRIASATVSGAGGGTTLVTNSYDSGYIETLTGLRQHDTANYGASMKYRGNVTSRTGGGKTLSLMYDITGTLQSVNDLQGHSLSIAAAAGTNYAAPGLVTPNSNSNLAESYTYTSFLALSSETGPNGSTASVSYDSYARPSSTTSPHGATTTYTYVTSAPASTKATTNGRWVKTTYDGLGRPVKVEQGHGTTTVSVTDTEYAACACSPLGKVKRVSQPYAPGGTVYWTTNAWDCMGRTTSVTHPDGSVTTYVYEGNTVKVTGPAGKWKKFVMNAFGNPVKVIEPNPSGGADLETTYAYNARNQLTGVTMPRGGVTQTRTFNYDLSTGRLSSATNPENGTVSYTYNADGTLATKIDARNQKVEYVYDSYQRVTQVKRYVYRYGSQQEDACQRMTYSYDTNPLEPSYTQNGWGRLTAVSWGGSSCTGGVWSEMYSYKVSGLAVKKKLRRNPQSLEAVWTYDQEGKVVTVKYPNGGLTYTYTYDPMGRPVKLTDNSADLVEWVNNVAYNAAGQMTQITRLHYIGDGGIPSDHTETREYNARNQLTRLRVPNVIDHEYRYPATANDGRITQRKDWLSGEEVSYQYDSLNRLISAVTTGPEWGQSFSYDGFGNLLNQTVTKGSAPSLAVNVDGNTNRIITDGYSYDANGNLTAMPLLTLSYDVENRLAEATHSSVGTDWYGYDAANRRVWKREQNPYIREFTYFYGVDGQLLGTYGGGYGGLEFGTGSTNVWFGGKLIWAEGKSAVTDRLGSVVNFGKKYYPYGEEPATTQQNHTKFATYYRDETTALDYAVNRYYGRTIGRFLTPDPYQASGGPADPQSWNRYGYVQNDPVNFNDPSGLARCKVGVGEYEEWVDCELVVVDLSLRPGAERAYEKISGNTPPSAEDTIIPPVASALDTISQGGFRSKTPCRNFFAALIEQNGLKTDIDSLMGQVAKTAGQVWIGGYIYDGPSSSTNLTADKFPNTALPGATTVGRWFSANPGAQALSQYNGMAVFFRSSDWSRAGSMVDFFSGNPNQYGLGTALHELLHKQFIAGGFSHAQIDSALTAVGMGSSAYGLGRNRESDQLGRICF